jgi:nucleotide-binding universal stress UspA family protein
VTIVVGYVDRPEGRAALEAAIAEARRSGERLVVVSVVRDRVSGADSAALDARLAGEPFPHEVRRGGGEWVPADALLRAVTECRARLVVIGMRERPVLGRLLPGATAQQLVLESPCDVLTVRAPGR